MTQDLSKLSKEELLILINKIQKSSFYALSDHQILDAQWTATSEKAQRLRDESMRDIERIGGKYDIKSRKARLDADAKWERAERLDKKADRLFDKMMAAMRS